MYSPPVSDKSARKYANLNVNFLASEFADEEEIALLLFVQSGRIHWLVERQLRLGFHPCGLDGQIVTGSGSPRMWPAGTSRNAAAVLQRLNAAPLKLVILGQVLHRRGSSQWRNFHLISAQNSNRAFRELSIDVYFNQICILMRATVYIFHWSSHLVVR